MFTDSKNIILDQEAFKKAIGDFNDLSGELNALRTDIEAALENLRSGFQTPAGQKFMEACEKHLLEPLEQQKLVIEHISRTLEEANSSYQPVFTEYDALNAAIRSYQ